MFAHPVFHLLHDMADRRIGYVEQVADFPVRV